MTIKKKIRKESALRCRVLFLCPFYSTPVEYNRYG